MARVLIKYKEAVVKEVILKKDVTTIGRKPDNDIVIDNQAVSGHHAQIIQNGDTYTFAIQDLSSLNGTYLNGQKVAKGELYDGDIVSIGVHTLDIFSERKRDADKKAFAVRGRSMDETVIIAADVQKKILSASNKSAPDALGGFIVVEGSAEKKEYEFSEKISVIGRQEGSAIMLKGFFAPKVAALVNRRKEGYFITPSSGKKIKVNGREITQRCDLQDGDIVEVAGLKLQFYLKD
jgi:pSer/pThr/pTyr-binding forkhead associated (FHA) protein